MLQSWLLDVNCCSTPAARSSGESPATSARDLSFDVFTTPHFVHRSSQLFVIAKSSSQKLLR